MLQLRAHRGRSPSGPRNIWAYQRCLGWPPPWLGFFFAQKGGGDFAMACPSVLLIIWTQPALARRYQQPGRQTPPPHLSGFLCEWGTVRTGSYVCRFDSPRIATTVKQEDTWPTKADLSSWLHAGIQCSAAGDSTTTVDTATGGACAPYSTPPRPRLGQARNQRCDSHMPLPFDQ